MPPRTCCKCLQFFLGMFLATSMAWAEIPVADLIQSAKTGTEASRISAIDQLADQGDKVASAVGPLGQLLTDASPAIRAHAANALGAIGAASQPASAALVSLLKDDDHTVRRQAVQALAKIRPGPQVIIPLFVKLMEDADPGVRMRILQAASEAGPAAVPGLIEALENEKAAYWACLVLREIGPEAKDAVSSLAAKLKAPDLELRREAALTLGAMQAAAAPAVPELAAALEDEHTRVAATFALGQIGQIPEKAERKIRVNAASDDKFLSTVSYWTLARVHPEDLDLHRQAIQRLVERIMDQDPFVRVAAARGLAALPPAPEIAVPIWEKALANADETTAHHAMDALASLGAPAVPRLIDVLKHKKLRAQAAHILGEIGPPAAPATVALAELVNDSDSQVACEAALALAKIGPQAKAAVPALSTALRQKESSHRAAIAYALGKIGPAAMPAEPAILESLNSENRSLAVLSAWALTQLHPPSQQIALRALPTLVAGLQDSLPQTRTVAAEALGSLGPLAMEARGALEKASQDPEPAVRDAATAALHAVRGTKPD